MPDGRIRNPLDSPRWPTPSTVKDGEADLELFKSRLAETAQRRQLFLNAQHESHVAVETAQIEVIKGSLERSRDSAKSIQTAAGTIATLYTGVAALVFSVTGNNPLPVRGVIPICFLGIAIVCATASLAWFGPGVHVGPFPETVDTSSIRLARVEWLNNWVSLAVLRRAATLRLATLYMAVGVVFLPVAFIPVRAAKHDAGVAKPGSELALAFANDPPSGATSLTTIPWPSPPDGGDTAFNRILYRAQIEEAVAQRAEADKTVAPSASSGYVVDEFWVWLAALVALVGIVSVVGWQTKRGALHDAIDQLTFHPATANTTSGGAETIEDID